MEDLIRGRHKLKEGKRELMGTIIHEELETRIMKTAYIHGSEKFKAMFNGRDKMIHPYICLLYTSHGRFRFLQR